jgi:hypothetical protein
MTGCVKGEKQMAQILDRKKLVDVLKVLEKVLSVKRKEEIDDEYSGYLIFNGDYICASTRRYIIAFPFKCEDKFCIHATEFFQWLKKSKAKKVELDYRDNTLYAKTGTKIEIPAIESEKAFDLINLLDLPGSKSKQWKELPSDFAEGLRRTEFTVGQNVAEVALRCFLVNKKDVVTSDDYRVSIFKMSEKIKGRFAITPEAGRELINIPDISHFCFFGEDSHICFRSKHGVVMACGRMDDEYYDYAENFDFEGKLLRLPKEVVGLVDKAQIFAKGEEDTDKKIEIKIVKNKLYCKAMSERGKLIGSVDIKYKRKKALRFLINPIFFKEILKTTFTMKYGGDRVVFSSSNFKHMVALFPMMEDE